MSDGWNPDYIKVIEEKVKYYQDLLEGKIKTVEARDLLVNALNKLDAELLNTSGVEVLAKNPTTSELVEIIAKNMKEFAPKDFKF